MIERYVICRCKFGGHECQNDADWPIGWPEANAQMNFAVCLGRQGQGFRDQGAGTRRCQIRVLGIMRVGIVWIM